MPEVTANGKTFNFPEGTSNEEIGNAIDEYFEANPVSTAIENKMEEPQEDQSLVDDVNEALGKIPGASTLTEFASGVNRSVFGALDFLGPDNINAILELSGSEKRVPTFSESFGEDRGKFDQGLSGEIAGASGELAGAAAGMGALIRQGAANLPRMTAGESARTGAIRQLGQTTAKADVAGGAAAGVGQEVGREIGGAEGAAIGSVLGPSILAVPLNTAKSAANKILKQSAPSSEELKNIASGIYKSIDESGLRVPQSSFDNLADDIAKTLKKEGLDKDLTPKSNALVNRFQEEKGALKSITDIDTLRKVARGASESLEKSEQRLGNLAIDKIDDFLDDFGKELVDGKEVGQAYKSARDLWSRARKSEILDQAVKNAENQASGFENGIRTQFRQVLKRIDSGKQKGFTKEERDAIAKVVQGTNATNTAKFLGKFGILDGVTSRSLTTLSGAGLAGAAGGVGAGAAVPLIGQVAGGLAERMTLNNAQLANAIVRAGKNGTKITTAYLKATPKGERSPVDLASLLIRNEVPVDTINLKSAPRILSDAAIITAIARYNDNKEK